MKKRHQLVTVATIAACAFVALLGVARFGPRFIVDSDALKRSMEREASGPLGLRIRLGDRASIAFMGDLLLSARGVEIRNSEGAVLMTAERGEVALALIPLLFNERRIHRLALKNPSIVIAYDHDGILNWAKRDDPRGSLPQLANARLAIAGGEVRYRDERTAGTLEATDIAVDARGLRDDVRQFSSPLGKFAFRAKLSCDQIRTENLSIADVSLRARAENGTLEVDPVTMSAFGGSGIGALHADFADSLPRFHLRYALSRFQVDECLRALSPDTIATGTMDFLATVTSRGKIPAEWARNLKGVVTLRGKGIELRGRDLDHDLSRFQASQNLDLMDVGSFFFVGPFGLVATKGYDFARLIGHSKGSTRIGAIVSSWKVGGGALQASDVAMATEKNRLALRGRVDYTRQRFDSVTVALVDKDGCAKVRQELRGTFTKPELRKPAVLMSLIAPARSIFTRAKDLLPGQCTVFYAGSVQAPD